MSRFLSFLAGVGTSGVAVSVTNCVLYCTCCSCSFLVWIPKIAVSRREGWGHYTSFNFVLFFPISQRKHNLTTYHAQYLVLRDDVWRRAEDITHKIRDAQAAIPGTTLVPTVRHKVSLPNLRLCYSLSFLPPFSTVACILYPGCASSIASS